MTGESHPLSISIKKVFKKMDKKIYFEPKNEVTFLQMSTALLVGSGEEDPGQFPGSDTPGVDPTPGGTGDLG